MIASQDDDSIFIEILLLYPVDKIHNLIVRTVNDIFVLHTVKSVFAGIAEISIGRMGVHCKHGKVKGETTF